MEVGWAAPLEERGGRLTVGSGAGGSVVGSRAGGSVVGNPRPSKTPQNPPQGEIFAAEGYAKVTGRVGVCIATSGPGATNLVTGLADAMMDSVPLVAITGQVPRKLIGTDGFQVWGGRRLWGLRGHGVLGSAASGALGLWGGAGWGLWGGAGWGFEG